jgi:hypothetical protein
MGKVIFFRVASVVAFIAGAVITPSKLTVFDNLFNVCRTMTAMGLLLLTFYLWNTSKK